MPYPPAPLKRRIAALLYESLLIGSVTILAMMVAGALATLLKPHLPALLPLPVSLIFLSAWWYYFKLNWLREGQTLPMRVWRIGLTDLSGSRPTAGRLFVRYLWACVFLVFVPLLAYAALGYSGISGKKAAAAALFWWMLPWGFALFHPRRQFLYDALAGTELIDLRR